MSTVLKIASINRAKFYDHARNNIFAGKLKVSQVQGMDADLDEWEKNDYKDTRWLAYMLATEFHETCGTMQPICEIGRGKGHDYGKKLKMGGGPGKRIPYNQPNQYFFGRGKVQITWYENYQLMGRLLGIDLLRNPSRALEMDVSVEIMFEGMLHASSSFGDFTGRSLEQYFNKNTEDWVNARRVINGLDCAAQIAKNAKIFYAGLKMAA